MVQICISGFYCLIRNKKPQLTKAISLSFAFFDRVLRQIGHEKLYYFIQVNIFFVRLLFKENLFLCFSQIYFIKSFLCVMPNNVSNSKDNHTQLYRMGFIIIWKRNSKIDQFYIKVCFSTYYYYK